MPGKNKYLLLTVSILFLIGGCVSSPSTEKFYPQPSTADQKARTIAQEDVQSFGASVRPVNGEIDAKYRLAKYFQSIKKHKIAIGVLEEMIQMDPNHAEAFNALGYSYDHLGEYQKAQVCYKTALSINPDLDHALNNLGYSYILAKEYEAAKIPLQQAIAKNNEQDQYHRNLALAHFMTGEYDAAAAEFRTASNKTEADRLMAKLSVMSTPPAAPSPKSEPPAPEKQQPVSTKSDIVEPILAVPVATDIVEPTLAVPVATDIVELPLVVPVAAVVHPVSLPTLETALPLELSATVEVLNGNGVRRMATNLGAWLKSHGVEVIRMANAGHFGHAETVIYYQKGYAAQASDLATLLAGTDSGLQLEEKPLDRAALRLLIGKDMASLNSLFSRTLRLEIANGNGVRGIARKVGAYLKDRGFQVGSTRDADHFSYKKTIVRYDTGQQVIARLIAKELPGNCEADLIEANQKGSRISVLLGADMVY